MNLYDTLTRTTRSFTPLNPNHVRVYVCGVTPYDHAHIGHARVGVVYDILMRVLKKTYSNVTYVRNYTDIDDKIIARAQQTGLAPMDVANTHIASFKEDMAALNCLPPTHEPRVSDPVVMAGIAQHIDALIEKGYAYATPLGDVMYRTRKFATFGALVNRKLDEQQSGARVAVDDEKENAEDFVLWKANSKSATKMEFAFDPTQFGAKHFSAPGRPGWHIECSVMSEQLLFNGIGSPEDPALFDIHGGGEDLMFPHHSCEIAQTEPLHPHQQMTNYWLHNAFITVGGQKMSKSVGNFTLVKDVLKDYSGAVMRLWLLQTHYRKPVDFSPEAMEAVQTRLKRWAAKLAGVEPSTTIPESVLQALQDDLNTPRALAAIDQLDNPAEQRAALDFLGLELKAEQAPLVTVTAEAASLLEQRTAARQAKNWPESDRLRAALDALGYVVKDLPDGRSELCLK